MADITIELAASLGRMERELAKVEARMVGQAKKIEGAVNRQLSTIDRSAAKSVGSLNNVAGAMTRAGRSSGEMRGRLQQLGFQVGDFAVQVGAGTSAVQALGQQLPQALGAFGAVGAAAGAAAAILVPLAGALIRAGLAGDDVAAAAKAAEASVRALSEAAQNSKTPLVDLRKLYGDAADEVSRLQQAQLEAARAAALVDLRTLSRALSAQGGGATQRTAPNNFERLLGAVSGVDIRLMTEAEARVQELAEKYRLTTAEAQRLSDTLAAMSAAATESEILSASTALVEVMSDLSGSAGDAAGKFGTLWSDANDVANTAKNAVEAVGGAVEGLNASLDLSLTRFDQLKALAGGVVGFVKERLREVQRDPAAWESAFAAERANGSGAQNEALVRAAVAAADELGVAAKDLLAVTSFESGNNPGRWGGQGGRYLGLIQFSPQNQARYGVSETQGVVDQMKAVVAYLKDTGVKPGDSLANIYAAVLAGDARKVNASDLKAGGVVGNVSAATGGSQFAPHIAKAEGLLGAYGGTVREVTEAERAAAEASKRAADEAERKLKISNEFSAGLDRQLQQIALDAALTGKSAEEQARLRAEVELTAQARQQGIDVYDTIAASGERYIDVIRRVAAAKGQEAAAEVVAAEAKSASMAATEKAAEAAQKAADQQDRLVDGLIDAALSAENAGDAFRAMGQVVANVFKDIAAEQLKTFLRGPDGGGTGDGALGGLLRLIFGGGGVRSAYAGDPLAAALSAILPGRAMGGPVTAGQPYIVGEKRPELFVPRVSGTIIPQVPTAGGSFASHTVINVQGTVDEPTLQLMRREMDRRDARLKREMPRVMHEHQLRAG